MIFPDAVFGGTNEGPNWGRALHLSRCSESAALHRWYLLLQAEGYQMVVQVLADLLPAMILDYAQAPTVYVGTDGSMC